MTGIKEFSPSINGRSDHFLPNISIKSLSKKFSLKYSFITKEAVFCYCNTVTLIIIEIKVKIAFRLKISIISWLFYSFLKQHSENGCVILKLLNNVISLLKLLEDKLKSENPPLLKIAENNSRFT